MAQKLQMSFGTSLLCMGLSVLAWARVATLASRRMKKYSSYS